MRYVYWVKEAVKIAAAILLAGTVYTFLMVSQKAADSWQYYVQMGSLYMLLFGAFMALILSTSQYTTNIPVVISFGATRKEVALGMHIYRLTLILLILLPAWGLQSLVSTEQWYPAWILLPLGGGALLFFHGLSAGLGAASYKWGKGAMVANSIITIILSLVFFVVLALLLKNIVFKKSIFFLFLSLSFLVYCLGSWIELRLLRKFCVK